MPALMHDVQTLSFFVVPPPAGVRTVWMLGFHRRFVRRCEWDTLWPKPGPLPQTSHTLATGISWIDRQMLARTVRATRPGYPMGGAPGEPALAARAERAPIL